MRSPLTAAAEEIKDFLSGMGEKDTELAELVKAVGMFIENYQRMFARTAYAPRVDAAANRLLEKLREL